MPDPNDNAAQSPAPAPQAERELPTPWKQVQAAIWLIGLAILFWQGWFWPGILILVAISGVTQALMQTYVKRQQEQRQAELEQRQREQQRGEWLPSKCPQCGGPLSVDSVKWTGPESADCPYCTARLRPSGQ
jgi:hypothetical protein